MSFLSSLFPAIGAIGGGALGSVIPGVGTAVGAMLGGSLGGALSAGQAAQQQVNAGNQALDLQRQMFQTTQANLSPYMQAGTAGIPQLNALLGVGGQDPTAALRATPGYEFARNEGLDAIMNRRSAMGGLLGGNTLKALDQYGTGLADQTYQQAVNNAFRLTGMGQNAAAGLGGFGAGFANQASNLLTDIGAVQAGGIMGGSNQITRGLNNWLLANALQQGQQQVIPNWYAAGSGGGPGMGWTGYPDY